MSNCIQSTRQPQWCILETIDSNGEYSCFVRDYELWCPFANDAGLEKYDCRSGRGIHATHSSTLAPAPDESIPDELERRIRTIKSPDDGSQYVKGENNIIGWLLNTVIPELRSRHYTPAAEQSKPECGKYPRCTEACNIWWGCSIRVAKSERERVLPFLEELASPSVSDARKREILESLREQGSLAEMRI